MPLTFNFGEENRPELFQGRPKTPVTLLSGFLGTGKTSLLKHLLENQEGVRIGVVVNDVAAVNIDSQLVKRYEKGFVEVTELQNGCICCSSADDLFSAVQSIVMRSKDHYFEHIVVELSGVGEPAAVKRNWAIGLECTMPVALRTEVKQVVTVVDSSSFGRDWLDTRQAQDRNEKVVGDKHDDKNKVRLENVGQLLAEQVEWADVIVVNKTDLATQEELRTTDEVVRALNNNARLHRAQFGKVAPRDILPKVPKGLRTVAFGVGQGYTWTQTPDGIRVAMPIAADVKGKDVDFRVSRQTLRLGIKGRPQVIVEGKLSAELKNLDDCLFEIEGSAKDRQVVVTLEKRRPQMWGGLFEGAEMDSLEGNSGHVCSSPQCTHEEHGHQHGYDNARRTESSPQVSTANRAEQRFGIHTFVYQRRRPFSGERLEKLLLAWPTPRKELFTLLELEPTCTEANLEDSSADLLRPVLRSKGFCWLDNEPLRQHVWAHAGKTMAVKPGDWWWAALDQDQLKFKVTYPGVEAEYKLARKEKWDRELGDRRQELVFIGGPQMKEQDIVPLLDACLLSDDEYSEFRKRMQSLKVPNDEFHVNGLLKNLGASEDEIKDLQAKTEQRVEEDRSKRKQDREDTDFLRSLGVGSALEPEIVDQDEFEAID
jgi:G3E family GTPase